MPQNLDVTFKSLFLRSTGIFFRQLFGEIVDWQNVEQPIVSNRRADLLARCLDGFLRHIEIQLYNDSTIPFRMAEYYVGFFRLLNEHVIQILLYVGREPLRMPSAFVTPTMRHEYTIINVREMDGEALLASDDWTDNEWALLTKVDPERVIRVVLEKLDRMTGQEQQDAAATFVLLGGILGIEKDLRSRIKNPMIDVMQNEVLGPLIREQLEAGHKASVELGRQEGQQEGFRSLFRELVENRYGPLPAWAEARIAGGSAETIREWSHALFDTNSLEFLLRAKD